MGKSEDRVWYFYKNVETGEHTMTTWDRMTDYFGWIEVTQKDYNQWVVSSELAPADADAPAAGRAGAGTEGSNRGIQLSVQPEPKKDLHDFGMWMAANDGMCGMNGDTDPDYINWRDNHAYDDMVAAQAELATLRQQLAAANDELSKAKSREKMYKHTVELHEEQYHQERDNARVLYRELRQHVSREQLEAIQKQLNNNVNEYDKLMSDASRGREALAKLAAAEADNARLRSALKAGTVLATKVMAEGGIRAIQTWAKDVVTRHFAAEGAKGEGS